MSDESEGPVKTVVVNASGSRYDLLTSVFVTIAKESGAAPVEMVQAAADLVVRCAVALADWIGELEDISSEERAKMMMAHRVGAAKLGALFQRFSETDDPAAWTKIAELETDQQSEMVVH